MVEAVPPLPTDNLTVLVEAAALCCIYAALFYIAYLLDSNELDKCKVVYFQEKIDLRHPVYCLSMIVKHRVCPTGINDILFRFRGREKDGPLILFRDMDNSLFRTGNYVNLGIALPYEIGNLCEIDLACDNDTAEEAQSLLIVSDIFVRRLPRLTSLDGSSPDGYGYQLSKRASNAFMTLLQSLRTWVAVETFTGAQGGMATVGIEADETMGRDQMLRARDIALSLPLVEGNTEVKRHAKINFLSLHYLVSLSSKEHEAWSDFSRLDILLVMCLDHLATFVVVATCYAYALERYLGFDSFGNWIRQQSDQTAAANGYSMQSLQVHEFNMYGAFTLDTDLRDAWFNANAANLALIVWVAFIAGLAILPLSLLWCRLFRLIGGKGFEDTLQKALPENNSLAGGVPAVSAATIPCTCQDAESDALELATAPNTLLLRTLECKSTHTASSVTSSRRLRMEPMLTNVLPDHITARSIAYVRTKMTKLRDEEYFDPLSQKKRRVLHESHTQSTDAPNMPVPRTGPNGKGEIVRVARFCERLVQQNRITLGENYAVKTTVDFCSKATERIHDNSVIAECFELAPDEEGVEAAVVAKKWSGLKSPGPPDKTDKTFCCPRQCCKRFLQCQSQTFSNATFFTEEDAASVKEMVSNFSICEVNEEIEREGHVVEMAPNHGTRSTIDSDRTHSATKEKSTESAPNSSSFRTKSASKSTEGTLNSLSLRTKSSSSRRSKVTYDDESQASSNRVSQKQSSTDRAEAVRVLANMFDELPKPSQGKTFSASTSTSDTSRVVSTGAGSPITGRFKPRHQQFSMSIGRRVAGKRLTSSASKSFKNCRSTLVGVPPVTDRSLRRNSSRAAARDSSAPYPSGARDRGERDTIPLTSPYSRENFERGGSKDVQRAKKAALKGNKFKMVVFLVLALIQAVEIAFVTLIDKTNSKYYESSAPASGTSSGPGRMHAAALGCLFVLLLYFLISVHLIALLSYLLEHLVDHCRQRDTRGRSSDYEAD